MLKEEARLKDGNFRELKTEMEKLECKKLLKMCDDCPNCKGKMEVADSWFGEYFYLRCPHCEYTFEG